MSGGWFSLKDWRAFSHWLVLLILVSKLLLILLDEVLLVTGLLVNFGGRLHTLKVVLVILISCSGEHRLWLVSWVMLSDSVCRVSSHSIGTCSRFGGLVNTLYCCKPRLGLWVGINGWRSAPASCLLAIETAQRRFAVPVYWSSDQAQSEIEAGTCDTTKTARLNLHLVLHLAQVLLNEKARQGESLQNLLHLLI